MTAASTFQFGGTLPENYQRYLVPAWFEVWAGEMVAQANIQPNARVLDVACGTGAVTRLAAKHAGMGGKVVGLDISAAMLNVARSLPSVEGTRVEWREASALSLPFADHEFDIVLCQQGLQFMPDKEIALREMIRVLSPGGRMVLAIWRSIEYCTAKAFFAAAVAKYLPGDAQAIQTPFSLNDENTILTLLGNAGFREIMVQSPTLMARFPSSEAFVLQFLSALPFGSHFAALDEATRAQFMADVSQSLQPYMGPEGLVFPTSSFIFTAYKPKALEDLHSAPA